MNNKKEIEKVIMNEDIKYPEIRITGKDIESRICSTYEARKLAESRDEDLILISENANPPVCRIIELSKFLYEKKKQKKEQEKKSRENKVELKEMRFSAQIDDHDFNFKKNHVIKFLKDNNKVRCTMMFKGREIKYADEGKIVLLSLADQVSEFGIIESLPIINGNKMIMMIKPKK